MVSVVVMGCRSFTLFSGKTQYLPETTLTNPPGYPGTYHATAQISLRSKPTADGYTNQCTYDERGRLITEPPAAGTADRREGGHFADDVDPVMWAAILDGLWEDDGGPFWWGAIENAEPGRYLRMYFEKRPILHDNCPKNGTR